MAITFLGLHMECASCAGANAISLTRLWCTPPGMSPCSRCCGASERSEAQHRTQQGLGTCAPTNLDVEYAGEATEIRVFALFTGPKVNTCVFLCIPRGANQRNPPPPVESAPRRPERQRRPLTVFVAPGPSSVVFGWSGAPTNVNEPYGPLERCHLGAKPPNG